MTFLTFIGSIISPWLSTIGIVVAAGLALLGYGKIQKRAGEKQEQAKQKEQDYENADAIRKRVSDAERVQPNPSKYKYRDK